MSPRSVAVAWAALTVLAFVGFGWHRWRLTVFREEAATRAGRPQPVGERWARTDAVLLRWGPLRRLARLVGDAGLPLTVTDLVLLATVLGLLIRRLGEPALGPTLASGVAVVGPPVVVWQALGTVARRRRDRLLAQVPDLVRHLASGARAGLSMRAALESAVERLGEPARGELRRSLASVEFGAPLAVAVDTFARRLRSREVDVLAAVIVVHQRSGGDLVAMLDRLATSLRSLHRARTEAEASARSVITLANVGGLMAAAIVVVVNVGTGGGVERIFERPVLAAVFLAGLVLVVASVVVVRRLTRLDL